MNAVKQYMGDQLSDSHYIQLNKASIREFGVPLPPKTELSNRLYFLLIEPETDCILASGYLKPVQPVLFGPDTYSFLGICGIIANEKGKGYGKQIMSAIRTHLMAVDKTGLGFCFPKNQGFYEKCGFTVETNTTSRFIYRDGAETITAEGQYILYLESSDRFMEKVLADHDQAVFVPDPGIW